MFALKRLMPAAGLFAILTLSACGDSVSPSDVDPQTLQNDMSKATETFLNNAAFQSVYVLAERFPQYAATAMVGEMLPRLASLSRAANHPALALASVRTASTLPANPTALFPANVLGKTLVWDTPTNQYVISTELGAPANGVRLKLYFANPNTGLPFQPLSELGVLDLTDESTPQADKLGVLLTFGPSTTIADYDITLVTATTSNTAHAVGYIRNATGTARVDFDLTTTFDINSGTLTSVNELTANDGTAIHVEMAIGSSSDALLARVARGNATLELTASGDLLGNTGPLVGTITFNTIPVATLGGTVDAPTVTGTPGHTFTTGQTTAMLLILGMAVDVVFALSDGIFAPGAIVFSN